MSVSVFSGMMSQEQNKKRFCLLDLSTNAIVVAEWVQYQVLMKTDLLLSTRRLMIDSE